MMRVKRQIPGEATRGLSVISVDVSFAGRFSLTLYISNSITDGQRPPLKSRAWD